MRNCSRTDDQNRDRLALGGSKGGNGTSGEQLSDACEEETSHRLNGVSKDRKIYMHIFF